MKKKQLVLASANRHKAEELRRIFEGYEVLTLEDVGFSEEIEENGETFEENALIKARAVHRATGRTVIADDSGVCVAALGGAPGVHSARYAGVHGDDGANNAKLLRELRDVPEEKRGAVFVSAAAVVFADGSEGVKRGEVEGVITFEERGNGGFGYDPLFLCRESGKRYAEMSMEEKNVISHRRRAFEELRPVIEEYFR